MMRTFLLWPALWWVVPGRSVTTQIRNNFIESCCKIYCNYITDGKLKYLYSRMNFVDLGGSERLMHFGCVDYGLPNEDSFFLNSDLKALSNVIHCLADKSYVGPIPYKDSRLTHILKVCYKSIYYLYIYICLSMKFSMILFECTCFNSNRNDGTRYIRSGNNKNVNL